MIRRMVCWKSRLVGPMALGLGSLVGASRASATPVPAFPAPAARLEAGATATVEWTLAAPAPNRDEMELLLSLDGGRTFPIRLTGRIPIGASSASWRVPALVSETARLALRAGRDEAEESEELLAISEPFAISAPREPPVDELFRVGREWRTREALEGLPARDAPGELAGNSRGPGLGAGVDDEPGVESPPVLASPVSPSPVRERVTAAPTGGVFGFVREHRRTPLPLRL
jgi:hypothetical protein